MRNVAAWNTELGGPNTGKATSSTKLEKEKKKEIASIHTMEHKDLEVRLGARLRGGLCVPVLGRLARLCFARHGTCAVIFRRGDKPKGNDAQGV
jgi:hypothetical protein